MTELITFAVAEGALQTAASMSQAPDQQPRSTESELLSPVVAASLRFESGQIVQSRRRLWAVIFLSIAVVFIWHWVTPTEPGWTHAIHIVLRKLFIVPILIAAIAFGMRGAVIAAGAVSAIYVPYFLLVWSGHGGENLNQMGEIATFWIVGLLAGWLAKNEQAALRRAADMSRDALNALIAALDAREHQTEQHSLRVAALAQRIGRRLGLKPAELAIVHEAAILHDVGKIGVPDSVLLKPGPLDDGERRLMQRHAELGYRILTAARHLHDVAELVYAHHERFDGGGYPRGLTGTDIPRGARIFAVADVYDALTSDRPYRRAMPREEAIRIIRSESNRAFDPQVVTAFLAQVAEGDERESPGGAPAGETLA